MNLNLEVLITFLAHLQNPKNLIIKPCSSSKNFIYIGDEQSSSVFDDMLFRLSDNHIYSITDSWKSHLTSFVNDPNSYPEFRSKYDYLLKRHKVGVQTIQLFLETKQLLSPIEQWINNLSENDAEAYKQVTLEEVR